MGRFDKYNKLPTWRSNLSQIIKDVENSKIKYVERHIKKDKCKLVIHIE